MQLLRNYFSSRSRLYNLLLSLFVVYGVSFLDWNPARIIAFQWIDGFVFLFFFLFYMKLVGRVRLRIDMLFGFVILLAAMCGFLVMLVKMSEFLGFELLRSKSCSTCNEQVDKAIGLFYPYFDFSFYLALCGLANVHVLRKISRSGRGNDAFGYYLHMGAVLFLSIPIIIIMTGFLGDITGSIQVSAIISCLVLRYVLDRWQEHHLSYFYA